MREWYDKNNLKHKRRVKNYKIDNKYAIWAAKYGIDEQALLTGLSGSCSICGEVAEVVDHDHATGKFRGFLCRLCNVGLGHFKDEPDRLRSAIKYLEHGT